MMCKHMQDAILFHLKIRSFLDFTLPKFCSSANQITNIFKKISEGLAGKPFVDHVVKPYYAIENERGAEDPGVSGV